MTDAELIKSKIDIVTFISDYVTLKKTGRTYKANCPFHSEKTPSFIVSPERGSWHCFGACSQGGDVITFLQKWENVDFIDALKILAQKVGVKLSHYIPTEDTKKKEKLYEINHLASEFYHYLLISHRLGQKALEYLDSRRIKKETIKTFSLGYAPNSWDNLYKFLNKKNYTPIDITSAGLIIRSEGGKYYDRFRGRIMFTLKDHRGNIIGFSGRKLIETDSKEAKYVNTPETAIYIKGNTLYGMDVTSESIKKEKEAVIVEGEFDFLSSFQSGITNVVAIKGSALTEGQILLLKRYTENLKLALDSDFAGNEAAKRGIEIADKAGLSVAVVKLPFGKDPAECIQKGPHLWREAIKKAVPIFDFIIDNALAKYDQNDVTGKRKIGGEIAPFLVKISNPIVRSHYVKFLAESLKITEESIDELLRQYDKTEKIDKRQIVTPHTKLLRDELLEEHILSLIIQSEEVQKILSIVLSFLEIDDFHLPPIKKIIIQLQRYLKDSQQFKIKEFEKILTSEIAPTFDRAFLVDINHILSDQVHFDKELTNSCKELKKISLRRRMNNLATNIKEFEKEDKNDQAKDSREKLRELLNFLKELDK